MQVEVDRDGPGHQAGKDGLEQRVRLVQLLRPVAELHVDGLKLGVRGLELLVHGLVLFVGRLELLVRGLQLLHRRLELLVGGLQLFVRRLQLLVRGFELLGRALQVCLGLPGLRPVLERDADPERLSVGS